MIDSKTQAELRTRFNPEGSRLRELQLHILDILIEIDRICRENNIQYWMSGGTLLGAIRHGGFIPWDDDIDIEMYEEDYLRFKEVVSKKGFSKDCLKFQDHTTDSQYYGLHGKVVDTSIVQKDIFGQDMKYRYKGIFVDVFIVKKSIRLVYVFCQSYERIIGRMLMKASESDKWGVLLKLFYMVVYRGLITPVNYLCSLFSNEYFLSNGHRWKAVPRSKSFILPVRQYCFEGHQFYGPADANKYLSLIYGEYLKIPKINEIKKHVEV